MSPLFKSPTTAAIERFVMTLAVGMALIAGPQLLDWFQTQELVFGPQSVAGLALAAAIAGGSAMLAYLETHRQQVFAAVNQLAAIHAAPVATTELERQMDVVSQYVQDHPEVIERLLPPAAKVPESAPATPPTAPEASPAPAATVTESTQPAAVGAAS